MGENEKGPDGRLGEKSDLSAGLMPGEEKTGKCEG